MDARRAAEWTTRHRVLGPLGLGFGTGAALVAPFVVASAVGNPVVGTIASVTFVALYAATSVSGYIVGLAGVGRGGLVQSAGGVLVPIAVAVAASSRASTPVADCPSCLADTLVFAGPGLLAMLFAPLAIGYWRGDRARSRRVPAFGGQQQPVTAPPLDPPLGFEFGGFWARTTAGVVDAIVVFVFVLILGMAQNALPASSPLWWVAGLAWLAVLLAYLPTQWVMAGRTIGMRTIGLRIVRDRGGGTIGWGTAFLRFIVLMLTGAWTFGLAYCWIAFDSRKRGWHDSMAGTVVIRRIR